VRKKLFFILFINLPACVLAQQKPVPQEVMQRIYNEIKTPYKYGLAIVPQDDSKQIDCPTVFRKGKDWFMTYVVFDGRGYETWLAKSPDLLEWKTLGKVMSFSDTTQWDNNQKGGLVALQDYEWSGSYQLKKYEGKYGMSYIGGNHRGYKGGPVAIGIANTKNDPSTPHEWNRMSSPILSPGDTSAGWWDNAKLMESTIIWDKQKTLGYPFVMYYNATGDKLHNTTVNLPGFERIGMAVSNDMVNWKRFAKDPAVYRKTGLTGNAVIRKIKDVWVMIYFGAFWEGRKNAYNRFACSYDLVHWTDWNGDDLIQPSAPYDQKYAHKSSVVKNNGVVYHFYCAVNGKNQRGIAVATSIDKGHSVLSFK
jgi:predicted GH43/DUF377 family glycosyl hydrolase